jgi:hypothetical protein
MTYSSGPNADALWLICETSDAERVSAHVREQVAQAAAASSGSKGKKSRGSKKPRPSETNTDPAGSAVPDPAPDQKLATTTPTLDEATKSSDPNDPDASVVEYEHHLTTLEEMGRADFPVYIGCQRIGDLVIIPARATHQVVNRGGLSCKVAWSRMTASSLQAAIDTDLPIYNL